MGHSVTLGGERLGAGKRNKIYLHNYERSTHNMSYIWRSTMAAGTLVPYLSEVALPGDTFDIKLDADVLTHPTIGPLFGSYKLQLDIFQVPIRLYQPQLHMNMLGIGMDMSKVILPQVSILGSSIGEALPIDNQQINPSCIFSYLGIRGVGHSVNGLTASCRREFNAIPYLAYWDIYKNYYANKQEEIGAVIHREPVITPPTFQDTTLYNAAGYATIQYQTLATAPPTTYADFVLDENSYAIITATNMTNVILSNLLFYIESAGGWKSVVKATDLFFNWDIQPGFATGTNPTALALSGIKWSKYTYDIAADTMNQDTEPKITTFPLENIDTMRMNILQNTNPAGFVIDNSTIEPYGLPLKAGGAPAKYSVQFNQEGLALKTYNSDLFNNWISTEWIDGADGISEITAVDTSSGSFTIDELNLKNKIYEMLNRIAISGGSYDDWLDAVYTEDRKRSAENPMYLGGLIKNVVFQEVISNAATEGNPLGTLAGRGKMGNKHIGGNIIAKVDEPSYIIGIVSLTPNIDYSQGNKWDTNLKTMNDLHKPALDEIGFQDLITDQMAWFDTQLSATGIPTFKSAGKQPAWINYMTNVNQVRGNFADQDQQMYMVLNRRYQPAYTGTPKIPSIQDLTTYIDPTKFNHIFADTRLDAQNFWTQIAIDITARRKMSAKVIPNL